MVFPDQKEFNPDKFKPKSTFKPRNKDEQEKLVSIEIPKDKYKILRGSAELFFDLKNDKTIVIKGADQGSAVVVWDRDDYIQEVEKQLGDKKI